LRLDLIGEVDTGYVGTIVFSYRASHQPAGDTKWNAAVACSAFDARHFLLIVVEAITTPDLPLCADGVKILVSKQRVG
jgi:hypothetical protein